MKESTRTLVYIGIAVAFALGAVGVSFWTAPTTPEAYSKTGEPMFDEFEITKVARLELSAIPAGESQPRTFQLAKSNDLWRLVSYHGYPAEAKDRLGKTAASVLGLTREALVGRTKKEQAKFGVLNPDDEELDEPEAAGKRIRMLDGEGTVLADLIVGKPVDPEAAPPAPAGNDGETVEQSKPKRYVRRVDEEETYIAAIDLDVSTKFAEWIEPDLLKLKSEDVRTLKVDNYSTKVAGRYALPTGPVDALEPVDREQVALSRDDQFGSWSLAKLDETKESIKTGKIDDLLRVVDEMTILGVAPRFKVGDASPLTGDLKFKPPAAAAGDANSRLKALLGMIQDLSERGFSVTISQDLVDRIRQGRDPVPMTVISKHGDVTIATHEGVVYHLHFGKQVVGTEKEIQIGGKPKAEVPTVGKKSAKKKDAKKKPAGKKATDNSDGTTRRYVLIRVEYDEAYYKDKPKKPEQPIPPSRPVISARKPRHAVGPVVAPRPVRRRPGRAPAIAGRPDPIARFYALQEEYRDKRLQYETDSRDYGSKLKTFRENVVKVKERVERLNGRFDGWYYVISTQNLKQLTLRRADVVGPKTAAKPFGGRKLPFKLPNMR